MSLGQIPISTGDTRPTQDFKREIRAQPQKWRSRLHPRTLLVIPLQTHPESVTSRCVYCVCELYPTAPPASPLHSETSSPVRSSRTVPVGMRHESHVHFHRVSDTRPGMNFYFLGKRQSSVGSHMPHLTFSFLLSLKWPAHP